MKTLKMIFAESQPGLESTAILLGKDVDGEAVDVAPQVQNDATDLGETARAADRVVEMVNAIGDAADSQQVYETAETVSVAMEMLIDTVKHYNQTEGGLTAGGLALAQTAAERLGAQLGVPVNLQTAGNESYADLNQRQQVSVAGLENIYAQFQSRRSIIADQAKETVSRMMDAIRKAIPDSIEKIGRLRGDLEMRTDDKTGQVYITPGTVSALAVDGSLPADMTAYMSEYARYGKLLLGEYSRLARKAAEEVAGMAGRLDYDHPEGFWQSLDAIVSKIADPRTLLTEELMNMSLPGSGPLFESGEKVDPTPDVFGRMTLLIQRDVPVIEPDVIAVQPDDATPAPAPEVEPQAPAEAAPVAEGADANAPIDQTPLNDTETMDHPDQDAAPTGTTVDVLSRQAQRSIAEALNGLLDDKLISDALANAEKGWSSSQNALQETRDAMRTVTGSVAETLGPRLEVVTRYVEIINRLSLWPVANYLANLNYTINAYVALVTEMQDAPAVVEVEEATPVEEVQVAADTSDAQLDQANGEMNDAASDAEAEEAAAADPADDSGADDLGGGDDLGGDAAADETAGEGEAGEGGEPAEGEADETAEEVADDGGADGKAEEADAGDDAPPSAEGGPDEPPGLDDSPGAGFGEDDDDAQAI